MHISKEKLIEEIKNLDFPGFDLDEIADRGREYVVGYFRNANGLWIRAQGDTGSKEGVYSIKITTGRVSTRIDVKIRKDTPLDKIIPHILAIKEIQEAENAA